MLNSPSAPLGTRRKPGISLLGFGRRAVGLQASIWASLIGTPSPS
jgi:hypothetical protein